jgi:methylmalonyl-CoA mutase cobalamin-binding domain/chain
MPSPIRILTAVPICDGHDSAINTINLEFIRHGIEVIYLGYHRPVADIVRAAIQEDVRAIGISSYNGGKQNVEHRTPDDERKALKSRIPNRKSQARRSSVSPGRAAQEKQR